MNKLEKRISSSSQWLFSLALVLSLFSFSGFVSETSNQNRVTLTEESITKRIGSQRTISLKQFISLAGYNLFSNKTDHHKALAENFNQIANSQFIHCTNQSTAFLKSALILLMPHAPRSNTISSFIGG